MQNSLTGQLLVASSVVADPLFAGGVCLVVHQDDTHSIGVMLNRPIQPSPEMIAAMKGGSAGTSGPALGPEESALGESPEGMAPDEPQLEKPEATFGLNRLQPESPFPSQLPGGDPPATSQPNQENAAWRMLHFGGPLSGPVVAIHALSQFGEVETGDGIYVAAQKQHLENLVRSHSGPCRLIVGHLGWEAGQLEREIEQGVWHVVPATSEAVFSNASEMWPRLIRRATSKSLARWIGARDVEGAGDLN